MGGGIVRLGGDRGEWGGMGGGEWGLMGGGIAEHQRPPLSMEHQHQWAAGN